MQPTFFYLQVHVSKPGENEFRGMLGSVGVYGTITEFLMQMTPPKAIQLITVRKSDKDMFKSLNDLLKVCYHLTILCYLGCVICRFQLMPVRKC